MIAVNTTPPASKLNKKLDNDEVIVYFFIMKFINTKSK